VHIYWGITYTDVARSWEYRLPPPPAYVSQQRGRGSFLLGAYILLGVNLFVMEFHGGPYLAGRGRVRCGCEGARVAAAISTPPISTEGVFARIAVCMAGHLVAVSPCGLLRGMCGGDESRAGLITDDLCGVRRACIRLAGEHASHSSWVWQGIL